MKVHCWICIGWTHFFGVWGLLFLLFSIWSYGGQISGQTGNTHGESINDIEFLKNWL